MRLLWFILFANHVFMDLRASINCTIMALPEKNSVDKFSYNSHHFGWWELGIYGNTDRLAQKYEHARWMKIANS